ncbi:MAG TPA: rRNA maturation RNase YbeY [Casimicrobiaceae bacterium]|nr:rRNA maturation RNase YbeY [Casimicrobiaceae bacterium]
MPTTATRARNAPSSRTPARSRRASAPTAHEPHAVPRLSLAIQSTVESADIPKRAALARIAGAALEHDADVTFRFVDGREGRALNRRYRGRDYATNVLTFVYDDGVSLTGDIVLCAPVIAREAREQRKTLRAHYAHLVIHGMLHLQGYDHERDGDAARMEAREIALLRDLGFANPYA